ncbi:MAG TPA: TIGR00282 family metallophosphoesterase [Candidatus Eisenbacteria bacterium]|nr:TIGR00282 family metallophosphoesterase [Candidatus Eisenbacteria bacterium]
MLNVLFIADVIGSPGRDVVQALLPALRRRHEIGLVVCNGENSAGGFGLTRDSASALFDAGVDVLTGGNHLWDRKDSIAYLASEERLVRPANLPAGTPGQGSRVFVAEDGTPVGVVNLLGRVFMREIDCPFRSADAAITTLQGKCRAILVDFHAETTAEKMAMGWHLDGRVSAVLGTHTHVQTADDRVLPKGTAYLSDAGMTGGFDSVIGMDRVAALRRFLTLLPERLNPAAGDLRLNGALVRIDPATGRAQSIQRIELPYQRPESGSSGARRLGGKEPAEAARAAAARRVVELRGASVVPTLALVSVGEDPASQIYLKRKTEACAEAGIEARRVTIAAGTDTQGVIDRVRALGDDPAVHGILVQLPLAPPADGQAVLEAVPPHKDVDGFHPINAGRLAAGLPGFIPATPKGILELLRYHQVPLAGKHAVVLGRSNIVGRPMATLLSTKGVDMTVTVGHSASGPVLRELARQADLLICAIGKPEMVTGDWIKPGAIVVDVGIHRVPTAKGTRMTGDVDVATVAPVASALTPVPGGVGPMTVAMVVVSTVLAAERQMAGVKV